MFNVQSSFVNFGTFIFFDSINQKESTFLTNDNRTVTIEHFLYALLLCPLVTLPRYD